jgi:hypothetical protein
LALFAADLDTTASTRLFQVIDTLGGRHLETPRDVVRALNALRLHAIPVREHIDVPDMVWLQLIRIGNGRLYAWAEEYMTEVAALANGATISDAAAQAMGNRLNELLTQPGVDRVRAIIDLSLILPGVGDRPFGNDRRLVFNNVDRLTLAPFIAARRLGSPQHYRYYFAFALPAGALSDATVQAFITAAENDPSHALAQFAALACQARPQRGTMAEVLVDRLTVAPSRVPQAALPGVLAAFAHEMDGMARSPSDDFAGYSRAWLAGERAVTVLLGVAEPETRAACLRALFDDGQSLGWLTDTLRSEIFAHGHYGDRREPEDRWLLTAAEFTAALNKMLQRYRDTSPADLLAVPNFVNLLYAWQQGSGTDEPRTWVLEQTATDAGLLAFLSRARSVRVSNDEVQYPLKQEDLERFLDYDAAVDRLRRLSENADAPAEERQLASRLLQALDQGRRERRA